MSLRKKVILYNPKAVFYDMPLALLAVGSCLDSEKFEVIIVDGRLDDHPVRSIKKHLKNAICFGVTCLTGSPLKDAIDVSKKVRELAPQLPIIWGGWHTSLFPIETLKDAPYVDISVQGQGEVTFGEIIDRLVASEGVEEVKGICYRDANGEIRKNPARAMVNMDDLPKVNYDLIDVEAYFVKKGKRQMDYISSTGCYFRCTFCADPFVFQRKWSAISPKRMGEELQGLHEKYHFTDLNFQDETFFTYPQRVKEIAEELIQRNIKISWAGTLRADQGVRISDEDFDVMARSGLRRVLIGVESGSQEMMDWLSKDIKIEQVWDSAERVKERNISAIFPFIVGFPEESDESVENTVAMVKKLSAMSPNFETPIFYFKPYPGSKITDDLVAKGYQLPNTIEEWSDFDYIGSSGPWVSDEKYRFFERFKFYNKLCHRKNQAFLKPLKWIAAYRIRKDYYSFPIEKYLIELLKPKQKLS